MSVYGFIGFAINIYHLQPTLTQSIININIPFLQKITRARTTTTIKKKKNTTLNYSKINSELKKRKKETFLNIIKHRKFQKNKKKRKKKRKLYL